MTAVAHINFDTFEFVETLKESGIPEVQAKAMLKVQKETFKQALDDTLATKADIHDVKVDIAGLRTELKADIADVRTEMASLKSELKADTAELKAELKSDIRALAVEMTYMRWMLGILILGVGSLVLKVFI